MNDPLAAAFQKHQSGRFDEAEADYRALLKTEPERSDLHYLFGALLLQTGRFADAESMLSKVLTLSPGHADAAYNLGLARQSAGNYRGAVAAYRLALKLGASYPDVRLNLGAALQEMGQFAEGELAYMEALAQKPGDPGILGNLAQLLKTTGRLDEALAAFDVAIAGAPQRTELHLGKAAVLKELGRNEEALSALAAVLALDSILAEAHNNRGVLLNELGRFDEAETAFRAALAAKPAYAEAAGNLGSVLLGQGRLDEALSAYDQALALKPDLATARFNRGFARLLSGDYEGGWPDWEARFALKDMKDFKPEGPAWDGKPLKGALLVQAEQGFGDTIQFLRFIPELAAAGHQVVLRCQEPLARLAARSFDSMAEVVSGAQPVPAHDAWAAVASLGYRLGVTPGSVPANVPYLLASSKLKTAWAARLGDREGPRIGLVWRGNQGFKGEMRRAPGLKALQGLIQGNPHIRWLSLQRDPFRQELYELGLDRLVMDLGDAQDAMIGQDFDSTAALLQTLDLVITSDTAVAHLAGALGVDGWIMLSSAPDWRWGSRGESTPWYPRLRLFRQSRPGDWQSVADSLGVAIRARFPDSPAP